MYDLFDLGVLPGHIGSLASALNSGNEVVGTSWGDIETRAFHWQSGVMTDLGTLGGRRSVATGINDHGTVIGWSEDGKGAYRPFTWTKSGGLVDLGFNQSSVFPYGINASGSIVGSVDSGKVDSLGAAVLLGFYWSAGNLRILDDNGQRLLGSASAINAHNWATGTLAASGKDLTEGMELGFLWDPLSPHTYQLTTERGVAPYGLNDSGVVVGQFTYHAFAWMPGNPVVQLAGLVSNQYSYASGINSAGLIVGASASPGGGSSAAIWFFPSAWGFDLNWFVSDPQGRHLDSANAVNGRGSIAGRATVGNSTRAFLLANHVVQPPRPDLVFLGEVILGAAGGKLVFKTPFGPHGPIDPGSPFYEELQRAEAAFQRIQDPTLRSNLRMKVATAITEIVQIGQRGKK